MPLWSPHLTASLWGGEKNLTRGLFFSLRPSFLVQPLLDAAFTLPLPWRFFPASRGRPQSASNLFQHPPSLLPAEMNHTGSFPVLPVPCIVLYHKSNICLWLKTVQAVQKSKK